jgi:hypothetical protein
MHQYLVNIVTINYIFKKWLTSIFNKTIQHSIDCLLSTIGKPSSGQQKCKICMVKKYIDYYYMSKLHWTKLISDEVVEKLQKILDFHNW